MSPESARAVLSIHFCPSDEDRMRELMQKNNLGTLTPDERGEMEAFRRIGSFLAIVQATARLHLGCSDGNGRSAK